MLVVCLGERHRIPGQAARDVVAHHQPGDVVRRFIGVRTKLGVVGPARDLEAQDDREQEDNNR